MARQKPSRKCRQRWVVKAGSNMVCTGGPLLLRAWMQQVSELRRKQGIEVIWVTSGAIASARERTGFKKRAGELAEKQALSAIGQPMVMDLYLIALQATRLLGAQILLTYDDLMNRERKRNFQNTVEQLLAWGVTPVLNENDAVATQEIRFGDNDSLSARVALAMGADKLVILTDVDGLYDFDPRKNKRAQLIPRLDHISSKLLKSVTPEGGSARGTGGMFTKLSAAQAASRGGIETWLVRGDRPGVLLDASRGRAIGTVVGARD